MTDYLGVFMYLPKNKLKIDEQVSWPSHFFGWKPSLETLQKLHNDSGVLFVGYLDDCAGFKEIKEPFVGFFHHVPVNPPNIESAEWSKNLKGLSYYLQTNYWKSNAKKCKGLYTLCNYLKEYLQEKVDCPVESLTYSFHPPQTYFNWDDFEANKEKLLLNPGNWSRDFEFFNRVQSPLKKAITGKWLFQKPNPDIVQLGYQKKEDFDQLLNKNLVFQSYFDVAASNTIIECIAKNTPIILNRLPAAEEYLGSYYPLFYNNLQEAESFISNTHKQWEAHSHLVKMDKSRFSLQNFLEQFTQGNIYQSLKNPVML